MMGRREIEEALGLVARLSTNTIQKLALLEQLERTLLNQWAKEVGVNTINFDMRKFAALKRAYLKARIDGKTQFQFEGHDMLVSYAKYLIEYLDMQFASRRPST